MHVSERERETAMMIVFESLMILFSLCRSCFCFCGCYTV